MATPAGARRLGLLVLGLKVAASAVWEILKEAGIPPAPEHNSSTWADFPCSQADALLACDIFEKVFPALFDTILKDAGIEVALTGVRMADRPGNRGESRRLTEPMHGRARIAWCFWRLPG